jgi:hypothetical protein
MNIGLVLKHDDIIADSHSWAMDTAVVEMVTSEAGGGWAAGVEGLAGLSCNVFVRRFSPIVQWRCLLEGIRIGWQID